MATQDYVDGLVSANINTLAGIAQGAVSATETEINALNDILAEQRPPLLVSTPIADPNFSGAGKPPTGSVDITPVLNMVNKFSPLYSLPPAPPNTFSYVEATYTDVLLTAVSNKLLNIVNNGWSSSQSEDAIWNRLYERLAQAANDAIDLKLTTWASRGWTLPTGMANAQLGTIITE